MLQLTVCHRRSRPRELALIALIASAATLLACSEDPPEVEPEEPVVLLPEDDPSVPPTSQPSANPTSPNEPTTIDPPSEPIDGGLDWLLRGEVRVDSALLSTETTTTGTLYVGVLGVCGSTHTAVQLDAIPEVDLRIDPVGYFFEVAGGELHLAAFLDTDNNADPEMPFPDEGDLVTTNIEDGTSCLHYNLGGGRGTIEQDLVLDTVIGR